MNYPPARMLCTYLLAAGVLSAVYAAAIEQYRSPSSKPDFHVSVRNKYNNLYRGQALKVRCRAKGGHEIDDIPIITFYRKLADGKTVMPLSSSSYGVSITASGDKGGRRPRSRTEERRAKSFAFKHRRGTLRTTKILHLHPQIYAILDYGQNHFYCRATTIGGDINEEEFFIYKL